MGLAEIERRVLVKLASRRDLPVQLETDKQVEFWRGMEQRGYVRILPVARFGFEMVPGDYLTITEAGRAAIT